MEREIEGVFEEVDGWLKMERRKRASVVLPEHEGPEREMRNVLIVEDEDPAVAMLL